MITHGNGIDTHFDDRIVIAAWLCHIAEVENIIFASVEFFHEMGHTKFFIHARGNCIDRGGAADFVIKLGGEFFGAFDDFGALFAVGIPGIFFLRAGFLAKGGESDLTQAIFDNFVAFFKLIFFPKAEFFGGLL